ncbi:MAG: Transglycosylase [Pseudomonadota bacterium]
MSRLIVTGARWIAGGLVVVVLALTLYDLIVFQPRLPDIRALVGRASHDERSPPDTVRRMVRFAHPSLGAPVSRLLVEELAWTGESRLLRQVQEALWWGLLTLHVSDEDQLTLFLALAPMGGVNRGFAQAAPDIAGVPLSAVSVEQAARLVTVARSPAVFRDSPELLTRVSKALVEKVDSPR